MGHILLVRFPVSYESLALECFHPTFKLASLDAVQARFGARNIVQSAIDLRTHFHALNIAMKLRVAKFRQAGKSGTGFSPSGFILARTNPQGLKPVLPLTH
jgi:hypothetical protein